MKIINLQLKKITVNKFFPKNKKVELIIDYNNGFDKQVMKNVDLNDNFKAAENIINDLRKSEKSLHSDFDGESIIDDMVNIVLQNEDKLIHQIEGFLKKVSHSLEIIGNTQVASGYLDLIRDIKGKSLEF